MPIQGGDVVGVFVLLLTRWIGTRDARRLVSTTTNSATAADAMTSGGKDCSWPTRFAANICMRGNGYRKYAWGHDALKPLSHQPMDWYSHSLLMTPVDGLDTMILMGLKPQADQARKLIDTQVELQPGHVREGFRDHDPDDGRVAVEL